MSQQVIYALAPDARARVNTVYMSAVFVGGAISSAAAGVLHDAFGWTGVAAFAAALPLLGLVLWATGPTTGVRRAEPAAHAV
jgi:predicted MFS family arabinose efflux permease